MPMTLTEITFRVALITETLANEPSWTRALAADAMPTDELDAGRDKLVEVLAALEAVGEHSSDHTAIEQARRSVTELHLWHETTARMWKRAAGDTFSDWDRVLGSDLEGHDELFVVLVRAWRFISTARVDEALLDAVQTRRVADDVQRGWVLLRKAAKAMQKNFKLGPSERRHGVSHGQLEAMRATLDAWLVAFANAAAQRFGDQPLVLGRLGVVPEGMGRPLGGTAFDVILHERGRGEVPEQRPAGPCPGWGTGAGGNRENYWEQR